MLYTIVAAIAGGLTAQAIVSCTGMDARNHYALSIGGLVVLLGTVLGGGIGIGVEVSSLMAGTHVVQYLFRLGLNATTV